MKRRTFIQAAAVAGLSLFVPKFTKTARADVKTYPGPYYIFVNAGGGWDPTSFCDPKGGEAGKRDSVNQNYKPGDVVPANGIPYAPLAASLTNNTTSEVVEVYSNKKFFETHGNRLLVLNGVDTTTNNHETGSRTTFCGQTNEGYPALAALIAAVENAKLGNELPMPFLSYGGFDATASVVPLTRAGSVGALQRIAYPNRIDPTKTDSPTFHTDSTQARIRAAQQERLKAMQGNALPYARSSQGALYLARGSDAGLARVADALQGVKTVVAGDFPNLKPVENQLGGLSYLMQQAQLALVAFQTGVAVSANLNIGGFDTHSNHDANQTLSLMVLFRAMDYLYSTAQTMGMADKIVVVMGSDFGRTPYYNDGNGKDHWNITSMMFSGPGIQGGRIIGGTDGAYKPQTVDPKTLAIDAAGTRIFTSAIHKGLRRYAHIDSDPITQKFPLQGVDLPIFG